jgi:hypothetical protein
MTRCPDHRDAKPPRSTRRGSTALTTSKINQRRGRMTSKKETIWAVERRRPTPRAILIIGVQMIVTIREGSNRQKICMEEEPSILKLMMNIHQGNQLEIVEMSLLASEEREIAELKRTQTGPLAPKRKMMPARGVETMIAMADSTLTRTRGAHLVTVREMIDQTRGALLITAREMKDLAPDPEETTILNTLQTESKTTLSSLRSTRSPRRLKATPSSRTSPKMRIKTMAGLLFKCIKTASTDSF